MLTFAPMQSIFTSWLDLFLVFVPVTIVLELLKADHLAVFISAGLAIIPLAGILGRATEHLTAHVGAGVGGLLNASLGNAAELIIALVALREGLHDVVKASLTGSIVGNILLVLGLSMLAGGLKYERQTFNQTAAGTGASLLLLAAVGLIIPALFHFTAADRGVAIERELSLEISFVLFAIYIMSLVFSLRTHKHVYAGGGHDASNQSEKPWSRSRSITVLTVVTVLVAVMSELLVGASGSCCQDVGTHATLHRRHSGRTRRQCGGTFDCRHGRDEEQDGFSVRDCGWIESADRAIGCTGLGLCELSVR